MHKEIKEIISYATNKLGQGSEDADSLIFRTGMAESGYRALAQNGGPALGFFQCEPATRDDVLDNYTAYRPNYEDALVDLGFDMDERRLSFISNIAVQAAFARLCYLRAPKRLPKASDLEGQAKYWKTFYNTIKGNGTVEHFIETNGG